MPKGFPCSRTCHHLHLHLFKVKWKIVQNSIQCAFSLSSPFLSSVITRNSSFCSSCGLNFLWNLCRPFSFLELLFLRLNLWQPYVATLRGNPFCTNVFFSGVIFPNFWSRLDSSEMVKFLRTFDIWVDVVTVFVERKNDLLFYTRFWPFSLSLSSPSLFLYHTYKLCF